MWRSKVSHGRDRAVRVAPRSWRARPAMPVSGQSGWAERTIRARCRASGGRRVAAARARRGRPPSRGSAAASSSQPPSTQAMPRTIAGLPRRQLDHDVAAPRLTGDDRRSRPSRRSAAARSLGDRGDVVRAVSGFDDRPWPRRSTATTGGRARRSAAATPSHIRAFDASPWTRRYGPPPTGAPVQLSTASSTPSATWTRSVCMSSMVVGLDTGPGSALDSGDLRRDTSPMTSRPRTR